MSVGPIESEPPIDPQSEGRKFSRERFLRGLIDATAAGIFLASDQALSRSIGIAGPLEIGRAAYEYRELEKAALRHPRRAMNLYDLWSSREPTYELSPFFSEKFKYTSPGEENVLVAFGDSNMIGAGGKDSEGSPVKLFVRGASERWGFSHWHDFNFAHSGATTKAVIENQLQSPEAREVFNNAEYCDVWINAGGNDLSAVVNTQEEILEVEKLRDDPLSEADILLKYASRMMDNLREFRNNFANLLTALQQDYGPKIRHLVILSVPDFSKASSITSQEIGNESYTLPLTNPFIRDLVRNISERMNNAIFAAAEDLQEKPHIRVIGLNTFPISQFGDDQHLTSEAMAAIAGEAVGRIEPLAA